MATLLHPIVTLRLMGAESQVPPIGIGLKIADCYTPSQQWCFLPQCGQRHLVAIGSNVS